MSELLLNYTDVSEKVALSSCVQYWHDMKFWWPQCEAVIATLYAYQATGDAKYLEMHKLTILAILEF